MAPRASVCPLTIRSANSCKQEGQPFRLPQPYPVDALTSPVDGYRTLPSKRRLQSVTKLAVLNLNGKIVTADALHTVTATAEFICGQGPPGQGEHAVPTIEAAGAQAADLRAGCGVQRASSLVSSPETRRFMRWILGPGYFDEPERLHLAGGGAQQPCRQAGDRNGQCGCQGDDREVDQR